MNITYKKKILHRAKYRGIKELDIIFDRFVRKFANSISQEELVQLEELLELPDNELLNFILNKKNIPSNLKSTVMTKILSICNE